MATYVTCPSCGEIVPRPTSPDGVCPSCRKPLVASPAAASRSSASIPSQGPDVRDLLPDLDSQPPARAATRPAPGAGDSQVRRRPQTETSVAAARMANAPTFKSTSARRGFPVVPIAVGVVLILAITAFALLRGRPASPAAAAIPPSELQVTTIGRPPEPSTPPLAEPDPSAEVVTIDLPPEATAAARARRKAAERAAPPRAAAAPAKEVARLEKPVATARPGAAPKPEPKVEPKAEPKVETKAEPEPPPPQFVAAAPSEQPTAVAPLAIGPSYAREGYQKARQARPGCVASALAQSRDVAELEGLSSTVKFAVDETGRVSQFTYLSGPSDPRIANAIWNAVQRCEWLPGATAQGRPLSLWVTMPLKFGR